MQPHSLYDAIQTCDPQRPTACIGIDPTPSVLRSWQFENTADGALAFGRRLLDVADGLVRVVKPQVAYFERLGPDGFFALTRLISEARERGLLVIADAKRGDIGTSCEAYAQAWLGARAPMRVDALTVSPYLGVPTLFPFFERAADADAYVFVVARSSNPEGTALQSAGDPAIWLRVLDDVADWSARHSNRTVGAVVGATTPSELETALGRLPEALFLAPGIGAQGASFDSLSTGSIASARIVVSSSRGIAAEGPDATALRRAARAQLGLDVAA